MQINTKNKTIYFYDNENNEIMYIDHSCDECIWYFNTNKTITITQDSAFYNLLEKFMNNNYEFNNDILINYKDIHKLIWYSDCYYNPDDKWSIDSVSCLHIEKSSSSFTIWCTKKLDEIIDRPHKTYGICFSPSGNGKYSKNLDTGLTLQDDFVTHIYLPLLNKSKVLTKQINY